MRTVVYWEKQLKQNQTTISTYRIYKIYLRAGFTDNYAKHGTVRHTLKKQNSSSGKLTKWEFSYIIT